MSTKFSILNPRKYRFTLDVCIWFLDFGVVVVLLFTLPSAESRGEREWMQTSWVPVRSPGSAA